MSLKIIGKGRFGISIKYPPEQQEEIWKFRKESDAIEFYQREKAHTQRYGGKIKRLKKKRHHVSRGLFDTGIKIKPLRF